MLKRNLGLILAAVLAVGLVGCSKSDEDSQQSGTGAPKAGATGPAVQPGSVAKPGVAKPSND